VTRTVLVTGGASFIGSKVVAELYAEGMDVVVRDRLRTAGSGKWRNLAKYPIVDFIAPEALFGWLEGRGRDVAAVVNIGAIASTQTDANLIIHTNVTLSPDLFDRYARDDRRFVYASSRAVYGDGSLGFYVDMREDLRPAYQYYTRADLGRLRGAGYDAPFASIEDGVADYVSEYLARADPYR
jgi:ADP-L-glycero-D-manno-heptose 6-epimerase